jgi:WD40 repeat protein
MESTATTAATCRTCGREHPGVGACPHCGTSPDCAAPPPLALPLAPGANLQDGRFGVGRVLGLGGFSVTYLGSDRPHRTPVAIKEFLPDRCVRNGATVQPIGLWTAESYRDARQEFLGEGLTLANLDHPGIVKVHRAFEENNTAYLVMEYLKGEDLQELVNAGGALSEWQAVDYVRRVGEALEVVHQAGLLHLDVKPDNIRACLDHRIVLIDFGAARQHVAGQGPGAPTMLTPGYAPLEQYVPGARRGAFTDVYALAATLHHLLTAHVPVASPDRARGVDLPDPRRLNPELSAGVVQALEKGLALRPADRPPTIAAFLDLLAGAAASTRPRELHRIEAHAAAVRSVVVHGDGQRLLSGSEDQSIGVWDLAAGQELHRLETRRGPAFRVHSFTNPLRSELERASTAPANPVNDIALSPDGRLLAAAGEAGICLWYLPEARPIRHLDGETGPVTSVAFSPDGYQLVAGGRDGLVRLWDIRGDTMSRRLGAHLGPVRSVAFGPGGHRVASAGDDRLVRIWDLARDWEEEEWRLDGAARPVRAVAFFPDGRRLASAGEDGIVRVWQLDGNREVCLLEGHLGVVACLAVHPNGRRLASGGWDGTVRLWDTLTRWEEWPLTGHTTAVTALAFHPDGRRLASAGEDGTLRIWQLIPQAETSAK